MASTATMVHDWLSMVCSHPSVTGIVGWILDAAGRPKFSELAESFGEMAKDPGRYLVIAVSPQRSNVVKCGLCKVVYDKFTVVFLADRQQDV